MGVSISAADAKRLGIVVPKQKKTTKRPSAQANRSGLFLFAWQMTPHALAPVEEWVFAPPRKWRFDWAFPSVMIAVEVDGGQYAPNGGRHARDSDREKLNTAAMLGWRVFRFSPQQLNDDPLGCAAMVARAIELTQKGH